VIIADQPCQPMGTKDKIIFTILTLMLYLQSIL
jgi:hypothetical protein